jgi:hypothetical protein
MDEEGAGRLFMATDEDNIEHTSEIALKWQIISKWVPKQLIMSHKQMHFHICQHWECYGNERYAFLDRIFMGEET